MIVRRLIGAALVVGAALAAGLGSRSLAKPSPEMVEPFREKGPADAPVTMVEFSDFQCPACRAAEPVLRQMMQLYGAKTRFLFKHFPLRMHEYAPAAATASECAGRQGKFWEYHDMLYDRQQDWTNKNAAEKFADYARELKLDADAFRACQADPSTSKPIEGEAQEARDRWVGATPTFFINGKRFVGARQLQERGSLWIEKLTKK